jgi:hypothetical protein
MTWPMEAATWIVLDEVPATGVQLADLAVDHVNGKEAYYVSRRGTPVDTFQKSAFSTASEVLNFLSKHTTETFDIDRPDQLNDYDEWGVQ